MANEIVFEGYFIKKEVIRQGNPICDNCGHRLEPKLNNILGKKEYPYGAWKCAHCQAEYEFSELAQSTGSTKKEV